MHEGVVEMWRERVEGDVTVGERGADRLDAGVPAALCKPAHGAYGLEGWAESMRGV